MAALYCIFITGLSVRLDRVRRTQEQKDLSSFVLRRTQEQKRRPTKKMNSNTKKLFICVSGHSNFALRRGSGPGAKRKRAGGAECKKGRIRDDF